MASLYISDAFFVSLLLAVAAQSSTSTPTNVRSSTLQFFVIYFTNSSASNKSFCYILKHTSVNYFLYAIFLNKVAIYSHC